MYVVVAYASTDSVIINCVCASTDVWLRFIPTHLVSNHSLFGHPCVAMVELVEISDTETVTSHGADPDECDSFAEYFSPRRVTPFVEERGYTCGPHLELRPTGVRNGTDLSRSEGRSHGLDYLKRRKPLTLGCCAWLRHCATTKYAYAPLNIFFLICLAMWTPRV